MEKTTDRFVRIDGYESSNKAERILNRLRINHIKKIYGDMKNKNKKILDIGVGEGFMAKELKIENLWGIDISPRRCRIAKRLLPYANISVGDAKKMKFKNNFFDGVICADVLEHMNHPDKAIKEMLRVVKKEGFIIVSTPNEPGLILARIFSLQPSIKNPNHLHNISLNYLIKKFKRKPIKSFNFPNLKYPFCIWQCYKFIK